MVQLESSRHISDVVESQEVVDKSEQKNGWDKFRHKHPKDKYNLDVIAVQSRRQLVDLQEKSAYILILAR